MITPPKESTILWPLWGDPHRAPFSNSSTKVCGDLLMARSAGWHWDEQQRGQGWWGHHLPSPPAHREWGEPQRELPRGVMHGMTNLLKPTQGRSHLPLRVPGSVVTSNVSTFSQSLSLAPKRSGRGRPSIVPKGMAAVSPSHKKDSRGTAFSSYSLLLIKALVHWAGQVQGLAQGRRDGRPKAVNCCGPHTCKMAPVTPFSWHLCPGMIPPLSVGCT